MKLAELSIEEVTERSDATAKDPDDCAPTLDHGQATERVEP